MKINIIACGGSAVNILEDIKAIDSELSLSIPDAKYYHLDSSTGNQAKSLQQGNEFIHIKSSDIGETDLSGSGMLRSANSEHFKIGVSKFLNENKFTKRDDNVLNIIIHSASGGSGSVIAPLIVLEMLKTDQNFLVVMVSDSSNLTYASNSRDTLLTYTAIAKGVDKTIPLYTIDNTNYKSLELANKQIAGFLLPFYIFCSDKLEDIDNADTFSLLASHRLRGKIVVPSTIMILDIVAGKTISTDLGDSIVTSRILSDSNDIEHTTGALNEKKGTVLDKDILNTLSKRKWSPLCVYLSSGRITNLFDTLENRIEELNKPLEVDDIDVDTDDDSFLVL